MRAQLGHTASEFDRDSHQSISLVCALTVFGAEVATHCLVWFGVAEAVIRHMPWSSCGELPIAEQVQCLFALRIFNCFCVIVGLHRVAKSCATRTHLAAWSVIKLNNLTFGSFT